jgi:hypothetical protein
MVVVSEALAACGDEPGADAGVGEVRARAKPRVTCHLRRLAAVPQGEGQVAVDVTNASEEQVASSASLAAFEGRYSFDAYILDGTLEIFFYENEHVQDETGSLRCALPPLRRGRSFCDEPIEIDASLGTADDEERIVHAFDFGCRVE